MPTPPWVLLAYRVPREPSTPRIRVWRKLRGLGVAQLLDGLVALPADSRTREHLDWLAEEIIEAGGQATVWLGRPASAGQERALVEGMQAAIAQEYVALAAEATATLDLEPGARRRRLARLRRELRKLRRRDFFPPPERETALQAIDEVAAATTAEVPA